MDQETNSVEEVSYGIRDYVVIGSAVELDRPAVARRNRPVTAERRAPMVPSSLDAEKPRQQQNYVLFSLDRKTSLVH